MQVKLVQFKLGVLIVAVGGLVGCASNERSAERQSRAVPRQFEEGKVFTSGDCFKVQVHGSAASHCGIRAVIEVTVGANGAVTLPLLGPLKVAGLNAREVAKLIAESYQPDGPRESEVKVLPCSKPPR
jgi:protein involved in polysaccharide export with SLBB domain